MPEALPVSLRFKSLECTQLANKWIPGWKKLDVSIKVMVPRLKMESDHLSLATDISSVQHRGPNGWWCIQHWDRVIPLDNNHGNPIKSMDCIYHKCLCNDWTIFCLAVPPVMGMKLRYGENWWQLKLSQYENFTEWWTLSLVKSDQKCFWHSPLDYKVQNKSACWCQLHISALKKLFIDYFSTVLTIGFISNNKSTRMNIFKEWMSVLLLLNSCQTVHITASTGF